MGDAVFVGSCSGRFYAFDRLTGNVRWSYDTHQDGATANFHGDALVAGDLIVVGSDVARPTGSEEGHVYAFELATGDVRWKHATPGGVATDILRAGDRIFGVGESGELLCLGLADGKVRWQVPSTFGPDAGRLRYSLLLVDDRLVFPSPGGVVTAVSAASGEVVWTQQLDDEVNTSLAVLGGDVFVGTLGNMIHRLDAATGDPASPRPVDSYPYGAPRPVGDSLIFLIGGESLSRIDASLENVLWTASVDGEWSTFRPQVAGGRILAGSDRNEIVFLDLDSGGVKGSLSVPGTPRGFVLVDGLLHVGTLNGKFLTYRIE